MKTWTTITTDSGTHDVLIEHFGSYLTGENKEPLWVDKGAGICRHKTVVRNVAIYLTNDGTTQKIVMNANSIKQLAEDIKKTEAVVFDDVIGD